MSAQQTPFDCRRSGILLHITSLPGPWANGDMGPNAYRFVDWLADSGQTVWQVLPVGPPHEDSSPYQCLSVHAGSPLLISPDLLVEAGWLDTVDLDSVGASEGPAQQRRTMLERAYERFRHRASAADREALEAFEAEQGSWLHDYALYRALRDEHHHVAWVDWPASLRDREPSALAAARDRLQAALAVFRFEQFLFFRQWHALKRYANERGVLLFGDMPIFIAHDSADVWAEQEYFQLDEAGQPTVVAGVPPDYFSATGQRWGNPHYRWQRIAEDGFQWWVRRMETQLDLFDLMRVDHFRGFAAYWEIPAEHETALHGQWVEVPGDGLFQHLRERFGALPLVAEDLGLITADVEALRERYGLPGMKVLQFAFDSGPENPYLPHHHEPNAVVYTGTHDNDTTLGWYESLTEATRHHLDDYLAMPQEDPPWPLIRCALASVARLAVVPMQDVLGLGSEHRMNCPGVTKGNWGWRFEWDQVDADLSDRLYHMAYLYGRILTGRAE